jgi:glutathione S-transferase
MLKVWGRHGSINVQKVLWCCDELGLAFERVDAGGEFGGLDTADYLAKNPNARIPTIDHDGFVLWESNTIVRYLCATFGRGALCPAEERARADVERWMDWQLCHILPGLITMFFGLIRTPPEKRDDAAIEAARVRTEEFWRILDRHLEGRAYVGGESFTMGDIPVGAFAYRWYALPVARPELPALRRWCGRLEARPAYRSRVMLPLR